MENSSIADSENNRADEAVLEALLEDAKKAPGEAALEALLAKTEEKISAKNEAKGEGKGEAALEALMAKADKQIAEKASNDTSDMSSEDDERAARKKARQEQRQRRAKSTTMEFEELNGARASKSAASIKTEMLIVHADSTQRSVLEMSFISEGYNVVNFETGKEALQYLKTTVPDIMLLDADMEKLTGMDICFRIRKIERFATVPVIIMAEANDDKTETMVKMCHANDFFHKANKNIELKAKVRKLLENSDKEQLAQDATE